MFVGLLLAGTVIGAFSGLMALLFGHSVWVALLIYSGMGALGVLAGALCLALQPRSDDAPEARRARDFSAVPRG